MYEYRAREEDKIHRIGFLISTYSILGGPKLIICSAERSKRRVFVLNSPWAGGEGSSIVGFRLNPRRRVDGLPKCQKTIDICMVQPLHCFH